MDEPSSSSLVCFRMVLHDCLDSSHLAHTQNKTVPAKRENMPRCTFYACSVWLSVVSDSADWRRDVSAPFLCSAFLPPHASLINFLDRERRVGSTFVPVFMAKGSNSWWALLCQSRERPTNSIIGKLVFLNAPLLYALRLQRGLFLQPS